MAGLAAVVADSGTDSTGSGRRSPFGSVGHPALCPGYAGLPHRCWSHCQSGASYCFGTWQTLTGVRLAQRGHPPARVGSGVSNPRGLDSTRSSGGSNLGPYVSLIFDRPRAS